MANARCDHIIVFSIHTTPQAKRGNLFKGTANVQNYIVQFGYNFAHASALTTFQLAY